MDGLDKITLILMVCLVAVALLFPLSSGRLPKHGERPDKQEEDDAKRR